MSEPNKVHLKMGGALLAGFALVLTVGGVHSLVTRGAAPSRDRVASAIPARRAALVSPPSSAPVRAPSAAEASSPAPLFPEAEAPAAEVAASPAATSAAPAPSASAAAPTSRLQAARHLDVEHQASVTAPAAPAAKAPEAPKAVAKRFDPPKLDIARAQHDVASSVHYGVTSRAELMGRAAGPVYNFSGKLNSARSAKNAQVAAGAMGQVDAAQATLENSDLTDQDKALLGQQLDQVKQSVDNAASVR